MVMRPIQATLLLALLFGGCPRERTIYRDSEGRIREDWRCDKPACLGIGSRPFKP
jgi:hypothetical protein